MDLRRLFLLPVFIVQISITWTVSAHAQQSWTFATDDHSWFGRAAPADAVGKSEIEFRCMAKGVDIASYPGDRKAVSLFEPVEGSLTILVSKRLQPEMATVGVQTEISVTVDGRALGSSQFNYLQPEDAFAALVPASHPMLDAIKRGSILTLQNLSSGVNVRVALRDSRSALTQLEAFCNSPRDSMPVLPIVPGTASAWQTGQTALGGASGQASTPRQAPVVAKPSFDCRRASHPSEVAICADPGLTELDRQMADL